MILLNISEILSIHSKLIMKTGGTDGVRDIGLLESAVYSAAGAFGDEEVYSAVEEKSARLCFAIISNHAFVDGNKRIGILIMLMTLKLNKIKIAYTQKELIDLGLSVAAGSIGYDEILKWILKRKI